MHDTMRLLAELGLGELASSMSEALSDGAVVSSATWRGEVLQSGGVYRLQAPTEQQAIAMLQCLSPAIYLHTLPDQCVGAGSVSYYAEHVGVVAQLMGAHAEHGDALFVISPGLSLRPECPGQGLGHALESLRSAVYRLRHLGVVAVLLDLDTADGRSEYRHLINRFVLDKLN